MVSALEMETLPRLCGATTAAAGEAHRGCSSGCLPCKRRGLGTQFLASRPGRSRGWREWTGLGRCAGEWVVFPRR